MLSFRKRRKIHSRSHKLGELVLSQLCITGRIKVLTFSRRTQPSTYANLIFARPLQLCPRLDRTW